MDAIETWNRFLEAFNQKPSTPYELVDKLTELTGVDVYWTPTAESLHPADVRPEMATFDEVQAMVADSREIELEALLSGAVRPARPCWFVIFPLQKGEDAATFRLYEMSEEVYRLGRAHGLLHGVQ